ncbi:hypothetical protein BT63DRAFT_454134 [Microthyrium microscopicum]|uniref:F-box domain-containing protein n=1 Tax=Microthyrium microscopicum TaxID=703497 RepID=A0A6A6UGD6_9PEZI|nr:hypothetical protein BT63DRAFT_454134 [Microthyrium microscopicum]
MPCLKTQLYRCGTHQLERAPRPNRFNHRQYQPSQSPARHLLAMPNEILLMICKEIPVAARCSLSLTCKQMMNTLSEEYWWALDLSDVKKTEFLNLLRKDQPDMHYCHTCMIMRDAFDHDDYEDDDDPVWSITLDNFYHISSALIYYGPGDCSHYYRCSTILPFNRGDTRVWVTASYMLHNKATPYLTRKYRLPISTEHPKLDSLSENLVVSVDCELNVQLCQHSTLKCLTESCDHDPEFSIEIDVSWEGPVWKELPVSIWGQNSIPKQLVLQSGSQYYTCLLCWAAAKIGPLNKGEVSHVNCEMYLPFT